MFLLLYSQITDGPALTAQMSKVTEEGLNHNVMLNAAEVP